MGPTPVLFHLVYLEPAYLYLFIDPGRYRYSGPSCQLWLPLRQRTVSQHSGGEESGLGASGADNDDDIPFLVAVTTSLQPIIPTVLSGGSTAVSTAPADGTLPPSGPRI